MSYLLIIIISFGAGIYSGKVMFEKEITAGACLDNSTKSIGEKYDDIMKIIKE